MRLLLLLVVVSGCGGGEPVCVEDAGPLDGEWRVSFEPIDGDCSLIGDDVVYAMYPDETDFGIYEVSGLLEGSCGGEYDGAPNASLSEQHGGGWSFVFSDIHANPGMITAHVETDFGPCVAQVTAEHISPPPL